MRLRQVEKGNEIITAIFADLDIRKLSEGTEPLEAVLARRLVKAGRELDEEAVGDSLVMASLQDRLGLSLMNLGHAREAIGLFDKAWETRKARLEADAPETLASMSNLGTSCYLAGKPDRALPLLEEALKLRKATVGADHPDTGHARNAIAAAWCILEADRANMREEADQRSRR
jgi:tetratricopeptide (TPR) repeat protein